MAGFRFGSKAVALASLLLTSLSPTTFAQNTTAIASSAYTSNDVSVAINVPEGTDKTDLYFSFEAPSSHAWVAFGIGMVMDNSLIFVVYRSQDDQGEPTVSPRVGDGHNMPEYYNGTVVNVLEGSEVTNDKFIAHIHCKSCRNWGEGSLDTKATKGRFFYALGPDGKLLSDDSNARIEQHPSHPQQFQLDITAATGLNGVPSFTSTGTSNSNSDTDDDGPMGFGDDGPNAVLALHAFVLCFAFSIIYPAGYLFLRLFERVWMHWGLQAFGTLFVTMGVGAGIAMSIKMDMSPNLTHPHQIIGLITFAIVLAALTLGAIGHIAYKRKGIPSPLMKGHRIAGPLAITLGAVNACVGLAWSGKTKAIIGYVIFDILVCIVIAGLLFMKRKRTNRKRAMHTPAAENFRDGQAGYTHVRHGSLPQNTAYAGLPPSYATSEQQVPLRTFNVQESEGPHIERYNVGPNK